MAMMHDEADESAKGLDVRLGALEMRMAALEARVVGAGVVGAGAMDVGGAAVEMGSGARVDGAEKRRAALEQLMGRAARVEGDAGSGAEGGREYAMPVTGFVTTPRVARTMLDERGAVVEAEGVSSMGGRGHGARAEASEWQEDLTGPGGSGSRGANGLGGANAGGGTLESFVGGRLAAIGGALFVLLAIGLFLKLGYDNGWIGRYLPLPVRCLMGGVFGLMLLGAGEVARRKISAWGAVGLFSAGVAAIYASVFAAYSYNVIDAVTAFVLLILAVATGIAIGARTGLVVVAIVSLVGGYMAPILLRTDHPSPYVLPVYLIALLVVGLALSAWLRGMFVWVGRTAWWGTAVLGSLWVFTTASDVPAVGLVFLALVWVLVHGAHVIAARGEDAVLEEFGEGSAAQVERALAKMRRKQLPAAELVPQISSFSVTSWSVGFATWLLHSNLLMPAWLAAAAGCGVTLALAMVLAGNLRVFVDRPRTQGQLLGAGLLLQAAGLLMAAIALGISGQAQTVVWLAVGVAGLSAGRWTRARSLEVYGIVLLGVGTARLLTLDVVRFGPTGGTLDARVAGLVPSMWMVLCVVAALAWLAAGILWTKAAAGEGSDEEERGAVRAEEGGGFAFVAGAMTVALLGVSVLHRFAHLGTVSFVWLVISGAAVGASWILGGRKEVRSMRLDVSGQIGALLAAGAWVMGAFWLGYESPCTIESLAQAEMPGERWFGSTGAPLMHPAMWAGLLSAVGLLVCGLTVRRDAVNASRQSRPLGERGATLILAAALLMAAVLIVWGATSMEIGRIAQQWAAERAARRGAVSMWWAVFAVGMVVAGFAWRLKIARYAGLGLLAVAAGKILIFDMADVERVLRIVSVFVTGLLMLGVHLLYSKVAAGEGSEAEGNRQ